MLDKSLAEFVTQLGSAAPTPGGGSVAALTGAQAAALVVMVCELTLGKPRYAEHEDLLRGVRDQAADLQTELLNLVEADIAAYDQLAAAYRLPRETEGRAAQIAAALGPATEAPLAIAESAAAVLALVPEVVAHGNQHAVSDAGMATLLAAAAVRSAALNVLINLSGNPDEAAVKAYRDRLGRAGTGLAQADAIYAAVCGKLA